MIEGIGRVRRALDFASRSTVPGYVALIELAQGAWLSQALYDVAVTLGNADALRDGPRSSADIARHVDADPDATYRLMRAAPEPRSTRTVRCRCSSWLLPAGAPPHPGMLVDHEMLVQAGGRERTAGKYRKLLARCVFRLTSVIPTAGPMSIVEAVPV